MQRVTLFRNITTIHEPHFVELGSVLKGIETGKYKEKVSEIRQCKDENKIRELKSGLPCVLFSGEFNKPITKTRDNGTEYVSYRDYPLVHQHLAPIKSDLE